MDTAQAAFNAVTWNFIYFEKVWVFYWILFRKNVECATSQHTFFWRTVVIDIKFEWWQFINVLKAALWSSDYDTIWTIDKSDFVLVSPVARPALGPTQLPIRWVSESASRGLKWPGREISYSPPFSAKATNGWNCTSVFPYVFIAWCLIKHMNNLCFLVSCAVLNKGPVFEVRCAVTRCASRTAHRRRSLESKILTAIDS